jgi:hypothetical protein
MAWSRKSTEALRSGIASTVRLFRSDFWTETVKHGPHRLRLDNNRRSQIELNGTQDVHCRVRENDNPQIPPAQQIGGAPDSSHHDRNDHAADAPLKMDRPENQRLNENGHEGAT